MSVRETAEKVIALIRSYQPPPEYTDNPHMQEYCLLTEVEDTIAGDLGKMVGDMVQSLEDNT